MNTNAERAAKADRVVSNYETDSTLEECLSDLLGDLRHFCDRHGFDFAERDGVGHRNYLAELAEERPAEPAYTVIGLYRDEAGGRFAETFYTHNGPSAAEALAKTWASEQGEDVSAEDIVIAAVIEGEIGVIA